MSDKEMVRTEEDFARAYKNLKWFVSNHQKAAWLVPTNEGYQISIIKPKASKLPVGTASNLYDVSLKVIDSVSSSKKLYE